jgi:hypothetical protein
MQAASGVYKYQHADLLITIMMYQRLPSALQDAKFDAC